MAARDVWAIYRMEVRSAVRERNIVVYSVLLPLLLYPALLWLVLSGISFVQGQTEGIVSRVALVGLPPERAKLREKLAADKKLAIEDATDAAASVDRLRAGELDAVAVFTNETVAPGVTNLSIALTYDGSRDRSASAEERVTGAIDEYRTEQISLEAAGRGIDATRWQVFSVVDVNQTSQRERGVFILRILMPAILIVMIALGCFYPAIDTTAGERERNTWETTMTFAAPRSSIVTAKFLYVATFGVTAGLLNIIAMVFSLGPIIRQLTGGRAVASFGIPLSAIPVVVLGAVLIALFIAAAMMIFASFAKTFKEGQTMVSPFYLFTMVPVMFLQSPDLEFSLGLAFIPVVNIAVMFRDAIGGLYQWKLIAVTVVVEGLSIAACLWLARWVLRFEEIWTGTYQGTLFKFLRARFAGAKSGGSGG